MKIESSNNNAIDWKNIAQNAQHDIWQSLKAWQSSAPLFNIESPEAQLLFIQDPIEHHTLQLKDLIQENAMKFGIPGSLVLYHQKAARSGADPSHLGALVIQAIAYAVAYTLNMEKQKHAFFKLHHQQSDQLEQVSSRQEAERKTVWKKNHALFLQLEAQLNHWLQQQKEQFITSLLQTLALQEQLFRHLHTLSHHHHMLTTHIQEHVEQWIRSSTLSRVNEYVAQWPVSQQAWLEQNLASIMTQKIIAHLLNSPGQVEVQDIVQKVFTAVENTLADTRFNSTEHLDQQLAQSLDAHLVEQESFTPKAMQTVFTSEWCDEIEFHLDAIRHHTQEAQHDLEQLAAFSSQNDTIDLSSIDLETLSVLDSIDVPPHDSPEETDEYSIRPNR